MALPKLNTPTYELELPSTGEKIKYRPFLVKEQKILMMAQEGKDDKELNNAMTGLVSDCTFGTVDATNSPMFDVEYIFLRVRGKSIGEKVTLNLTCPDDEETQVPVTIDLDDIKVVKNDDHTNRIKLSDDLMMEMKYPSLDEFIKNNFDFADKNQMDQSFELIASCIDKIFSEDEVWATEDCTKKELNEFLEQMNSSQFKDIEKFFETMPKLSHKLKVKNPKTKKENEVVLEGLASFFA